MPPICLHLIVAKEAASRFEHPILSRNMGTYLLGSTTPDIRLITGMPREKTHFFDLESPGNESGVKLLLRTYPYLSDTRQVDQATRAFIAGYLSHLVTDEFWILNIYRRFLSGSSPLADEPVTALLDRALQFDLDYRERLNRTDMMQIASDLSNSDVNLNVGLFSAVILKQWREFVYVATAREPSWSRFRIFAERILIPPSVPDYERVTGLLSSVPAMLQQAFKLVPQEAVSDFREKAIADSVAVAKEYLA